LKVSISQQLWIQPTPNDLIARNVVDVKVPRSAHNLLVVDVVEATVRNAAQPRAVVRWLEVVITTQYIDDLKNQPRLNQDVTEVAVRNGVVAPDLAGQAEATLLAVVMMRLAAVVLKDRLRDRRRLSLVRKATRAHRTVHGHRRSPGLAGRVLHRATISLVMDYSLRDRRRSQDQNKDRHDVAASDQRGQTRNTAQPVAGRFLSRFDRRLAHLS
jgi:hypothetical protein